MRKERIHIDMDHCAVDFEKGKQEWLEKFPDEAVPHSHMEFWINLEPMPGFKLTLCELEEKFDVYLLTAPSLRNRACWTGKAIWVYNHLGPEYLSKLIESYDKSQFSGAYLIDDGDRNGQTRYNGEHIQFGHSKEFSRWMYVMDYINDNYKPEAKAVIPDHMHFEAIEYVKARASKVEDIDIDELQNLVIDGMLWALKNMKSSYPAPEYKEHKGGYKPPFYNKQ